MGLRGLASYDALSPRVFSITHALPTFYTSVSQPEFRKTSLGLGGHPWDS